MDRLNFNHFYYFYIVAQEGSIKLASEKLFVTQPTISEQIRLLEEYFECKLFVRKNRQLILSKEGELAFTYAKDIFQKGQDLTYQLRHDIKIPKKSIDIGISQFMSQYFLYDTLLPLFSQNEISIHVEENQRHHLIADLVNGDLDMVFTDRKDFSSHNIISHRVGMNKTFVVAHKKYHKHKKNFPESLTNIPFFHYTEESVLKYEIDLFFSQVGVSPKKIGEGDDMDLFQMVVENGKAFAIVPEAAKNRFCLNKDVVALGEIKELQTYVWALMHKDYKGLGYQLITNQLLK